MAPGYAAGGGGSTSSLINMIGLGLVALGLLLRGITGLLNPGSASVKMGAVANMFIAFGLLAVFFACLAWAKEKDGHPAVKAVVAGGALLIVLPMAVYFMHSLTMASQFMR
jgi:hypothetical protein